MEIGYDENKRLATLEQRGLDFARVGDVFAGHTFDQTDTRWDYGEKRLITAGRLDGRVVVIVWTRREHKRRIISMRKANQREVRFYEQYLSEP